MDWTHKEVGADSGLDVAVRLRSDSISGTAMRVSMRRRLP